MWDHNIYTVGGTVQAGSGVYLQRHADGEMLAHCRAGNFAYVLTARQLGKSSLMVRTADQLTAEGICTAVIDLTELGVQATSSEWYLGLILKLAFELNLDKDIFAWWVSVSHVSLVQRLIIFFRDVVLPQIPQQIVIFVDEIDSTLNLDFTDDFFAAIRYLYNARALECEFTRLSFVLIGVAMPGDLIDDPKRTPFNIGERVELNDFTVAEAVPLAADLAADPRHAQEILGWILRWTGGHPYLTQRLCKVAAVQARPKWSRRAIADLVKETFLGEKSRSDSNLQFVRDMLTIRAPDQMMVLSAYRDIRSSWWPIKDDEQSITLSHLKLSGIIRRDNNILVVRNQIYKCVFDRHWIDEHLLSNWWRDMPPTVKVAAVVSIFLLAAFLTSTLLAIRNSILANERANLATERYLIAQSIASLDTQYDLALLLGLEAYHVANTPETNANIRSELVYNPYVFGYLRGHDEPVNSIAFSPDGRLLASSGDDGLILLWDVAQQKLVASLPRVHTYNATSLVFSPDSRHLVSGGCASYKENQCSQSEIIVWNLDAKPIPLRFIRTQQDQLWDLTFNPEGDRLAAISNQNLIVWDTMTWEPVWQMTPNDSKLISLEFNPINNTMLVVGTEAGHILVLDATTGVLTQQIQAHQGRIYQVAFTPDGKQLATASGDGTLGLWDTETWQSITQLIHHTDQVVSLDFNPTGNLLVSTGLDGLIIIWDVQAGGDVTLILSGHRGSARKALFYPDGNKNLLVSNGPNNAIILWNLHGDRRRSVWLSSHQDSVLGVDFSADGTVLASASADKSIAFWDVASAGMVGQISDAHQEAVRQVVFDPTGQYLASAGRDYKIRLWPISGDMLTPIELVGHESIVRSINFSPDGTWLASSDDNGRVLLWEVTTGQLIMEFADPDQREIFDVEFSPDGSILASGGWNGTVQFWDVSTFQPLYEPLSVGIGQIWDIAFSPTGNLLAVAGTSEKIILIDVPKGRIASQLLTSHTNRINALAFNPNGTMLASGGADNLIMLWDITTQQLSGLPIQLHSDEVYRMAFSPDGRLLASGDLMGKILLTTIYYESPEETICGIVGRNLTSEEWTQYIGADYVYHESCPNLP